MMRPMPFCPSFEPWAKLTPVQVRISRPRIHQGGGVWPSGALYSEGILMKNLQRSSSDAARMKPTAGENSSDLMTPTACIQSTPLVPSPERAKTWFMMPTPMIEPTMACELEFGMPNHQVPRFQMIAAINSAKTMATPAPLPTCRISSTGSSEMMPKATAPLDVKTPRKLKAPDHTTAIVGGNECV